MAEDHPAVDLRPIPGFDDYAASEDGRIWRITRHPLYRRQKGIPFEPREMHPGRRPSGSYLFVRIKGRDTAVHILMALAFRGPRPSKGHVAAHDDGNPLNNCADNIFWKTFQGNSDDRVRHGRSPRGERHHCAKLTKAQVNKIREDAPTRTRGYCSRKAKELGVSLETIWKIVAGRTWHHREPDEQAERPDRG